MSSALDVSLDDIIKNKKKSSAAVAGRRGRGRGGSGPTRRPSNLAAIRSNPYSIPQVTKPSKKRWLGFTQSVNFEHRSRCLEARVSYLALLSNLNRRVIMEFTRTRSLLILFQRLGFLLSRPGPSFTYRIWTMVYPTMTSRNSFLRLMLKDTRSIMIGVEDQRELPKLSLQGRSML